MSFRGGRGGSFGGGSSRGGRGGFGSNRYQDSGASDEVLPLGSFLHASEGDMFCKSTNEKIPYFNAPVYLENKTQIGKVDEILGPLNEVFFTVKCQEGVVASSFKAEEKVFIGSDKLLPVERFLPKPKGAKVKKVAGASRGGSRGGFGDRGGRGGSRGGSRGGFGASRGGSRGGFGASRGGSRGGFGGSSRGGSRGGFSGGSRGGFRGRS